MNGARLCRHPWGKAFALPGRPKPKPKGLRHRANLSDTGCTKTTDPGRNKLTTSGRRGAHTARREERAYREYVSDEQRSRAGWIGGQMGNLFLLGS